ncbi:MAG: PAS domain-containing sensor histidine kinase [Emticicia sp.]|uniref:PAS domain-containing sensor histidine kinase n=1 Tax=Emticicia sp. TaxID=1930953 RepID=UPI003BA76848
MSNLKIYEQLLNSINEAVLVQENNASTADEIIVFVNNAFCEIVNYSANELVGNSCSLLFGTKTDTTLISEKSSSSDKQFSNNILYDKHNKEIYCAIEAFSLDNYRVSIITVKNEQSFSNNSNLDNDFNRTVLESSPDCLKVIDVEGRIHFMNFNGLCQMEIDDFGEFKYRYWWDLWGEENRDLVRSAVEKAKKGESANFTAFCATAKGTPKWWDVMVSPIRHKSHDVSQIIATSRDVTLQKETLEKLEKGSQLLYTGLKVANVGIAEINYATNTVTLSTEAAHMYGLSTSQRQISRETFHQTIHPLCKVEMKKKIEGLLSNHSNDFMEVEHRIILPDNQTRWLKVRMNIFFDHSFVPPKPKYSILAAQDITEQKNIQEETKQNELRFKTLANSIPQLAWMTDAEGYIYWYNDRWYEYTGTTFEEMQGWGWQKVHHPDLVAGVVEKFSNAIQKGTDWEDTFLLRGKDGEYRWFLSRATAIRNKDNQVIQWFGTNTDVSVVKESEKALNLLNASLEEKVKVRTEELELKNQTLQQMNEELASFNFIANHDLKEPLRKIQLFTSLVIEDKSITEQSTQYLTKVLTSVHRMQNLLNDLQKYAAANEMTIASEYCDLNQILESVKHQIQETSPHTAVNFEISPLPVVKGLEFLLNQLFTNIIENSIIYAKQNQPILIKIHAEEVNGRFINEENAIPYLTYHCIKISDNGIGFDQIYANKIFDLFQRLHTNKTYSGTGIGLAICKKIVTRLSGFIAAKGEVNVGATFIIYLPKI